LESIDIAFDESTPDIVFSEVTKQIKNSQPEKIERIRAHLVMANQIGIDHFFNALQRRLGRYVTRVIVIPLYGRMNEFITIEDALSFIDKHKIYEGSGEFRKYEIHIEFSNGDKVDASIESKDKIKEFLTFVAGQ
jgi:hypothetical protein